MENSAPEKFFLNPHLLEQGLLPAEEFAPHIVRTEEIDQVIVQMHHLQLSATEFLELVRERLEVIETKKRAQENLAAR